MLVIAKAKFKKKYLYLHMVNKLCCDTGIHGAATGIKHTFVMEPVLDSQSCT